jgi:N-acetylglutamate synthase-like GNAT family acetyltransferase/2-polyprenyl-3-methyl-5-hydroxy-6-metoxy-1,4-benzoquinol methylase
LIEESEMSTDTADRITSVVREKYGEAARRVLSGEGIPADCCGKTGCCSGAAAPSCDPITSNLYATGQTDELPSAAVLASLGCGNPTALAELHPGEVVLDLGSGGGIDVLLSARRVGPTGKAYGLDMTDEMLALAKQNAEEAGVTNVEFLRGRIEQIPLPGNSVDVIISNCVINLSGDKRAVLAEAFRVLKPGGRFAVSDVIVRGEAPAEVRKSMELWIGCVAGALEEQEFLVLLREVGFENPSIEPTRIYQAEDAAAFLAGSGLDVDKLAREIDGRFMSGFVRATKPVAAIRHAVGGDLPGVEQLLVTSHLPTDGVAEALDGFLVAEHAGKVVGVVGVEECGEYGLLRSTAVSPEWRRRGLGRQLVQRAIAEAESKGVRALYLLTTTAEQYFPGFGFSTTSRESVPDAVRRTGEFTSACPASATVMVRARTSEPAMPTQV